MGAEPGVREEPGVGEEGRGRHVDETKPKAPRRGSSSLFQEKNNTH